MQLTKREKLVVLGGIGAVALVMAIQFVVHPRIEHITTLRRVVADKTEVLAQMQAKRLEYQGLKAEIGRLHDRIDQQQEGHRVLSAIEGVRKACGLPDNVLSLKPATAPIGTQYTQTTVEMRLERVSLAQLTNFLSELESLSLAGGVRGLDIRTTDRNVGSLQAVIQLAVVLPAGGM